MRWCVIVVAALALQGCELDGDCPLVGVDAVRLWVQDGETGGKLSSAPVGTLTDGDYRENMGVYDLSTGHQVSGGGLRAGGPYDIEVRAAGYRTWTMRNVALEMDRRCDKPAETFQRTVDMRPLEPSPWTIPSRHSTGDASAPVRVALRGSSGE
ncbi:MAG: hypothetical protein OXU64_04760 [Gemmatimonadota bacterium]|nr:hypothetical protein [Gemmatimonadota bacterium]